MKKTARRNLRRTYLVVAIIAITVAALLGYTLQHYLGGPITPPKTVVSGHVSSIQPNSNFTIILFLNTRTNVTYGVPITPPNGTRVSACNSPCVYSVALFSNDPYNPTIQVETTRYGAVPCPAPPSFTPTGPTLQRDLICPVTF